MTKSERKLLALVARMVIRLARNAGFDNTAREVEEQYQEAAANVRHEEAMDEFSEAMAELNKAEVEYSLEHTGGGIYVLYHRWDPDPAGPHVGVTRDEDNPSLYLVVGYRDAQDEGSFIRRGVSAGELGYFVKQARERVETRIWMVPGEFFIHQHANGVLTFKFLPSGSDAGYFGPPAINWETGVGITEDQEEVLWAQVAEHIGYGKGQVEVSWEG